MTLRGLRDFFFKPVPPAPGYQALVIPTSTTAVPIVPVVIPKDPPPVKVVHETKSVIIDPIADKKAEELRRIARQREEDELAAKRRRAREEDEEDERRRQRERDNDSLFQTVAAVEIAESFSQPSYDPGRPSYTPDPTPSFDAGGGSFGGGGASSDW